MKRAAVLVGGLGLTALILAMRGHRMPASPGVSFPTSTESVDPRPTQEDVTAYDAMDRVYGARPGVEKFRSFVLGLLGGKDLGIWSSAQHQSQNAHSEHDVGRAWDWGFASSADAQTLIAWLHANDDEWMRRFGIGYLISDRRMYRDYDPVGWSSYNGADAHTTHVHFSFSKDGAFGKTSGYDFYQDNRAIV